MSATDTPRHHVVVVGGGISGLAAAHRLAEAGARVTLLEGSGRVGGKLLAGEIAGVPVDLGAESMLARRPEAVGLARAVGLADRLQAPAATALLWTRGELRPLPQGHMMGVPGDLGPLAASGVLSPEGLARISRDAELPRTELGEDVAIGAYVAERMGREVVDRLVEPLLGGVYAGDAYRISMRTAVPQLFEAARTHRTLAGAVRDLQARAAARQQSGPVFMGVEGGVGRLPLAVADAVRARGGVIRTQSPVAAVERAADGWRVVLGTGSGAETLAADAVVVATPAHDAARLLGPHARAAVTDLATVEYASMALVTMAFRRSDAAALPRGSGFLVPPVDGRKIKAATFSSDKWRWNADSDPDLFVLRTSIGRFGDEADLEREDADLVALSLADLGAATGLAAAPVASRVTRWRAGLPQYPVGHLERVARIRADVARLPGLRVCGAAYDGVGIPACVSSAHKAADEILAALPTLTAGAGTRE
ncbi:protoporphyrinogen oxidase [Streptomyces eurocidicus]|uniref:Coproporphyrinogen III oxidase n=1 Tax=Streptomyces eurocidicus TaxID=66423 RepID=A0A2N8NVU8_STREU|nr:protoporphyrinogen oxidase [Streptomyces eurocidicus]MBB5119172.1 oxygen-dependent protoporphyrinogen oxidase [Streptomyces eurocidicus]MBF6051726.1 protoporphyrinogen oxidase [Streptomyces eurocidicus]PNE32891.1 protoporphyrinogen oxidase [Streptomyces eurocidicus]